MKFKLIEDSKKCRYYNDGTTTIRVYDGETPPDGFKPGTLRVPWNKGLTADTDDRVKANVDAAHATRNAQYHPAWNKGLTKETDDRVADYAKKLAGENNPMYGTHREVWNKGLTKETDDRMRRASDSLKGRVPWNKGKEVIGHPQSTETREKIRITHMDDDFKAKRYQLMKDNGTLFVQDSKAEQSYYEFLKKIYGEDNIIRQYFDRERYPFKCDFYIPSEDKFIEVNANWTHGGRPFDPNDPECIAKLNLWQERSKVSKYYKNAIYTWTNLDVRKLETAKKNNLNFEVIY